MSWWGIGNEMFGAWQLGNVPVQRYAVRHNAFVRAMKGVRSADQDGRRRLARSVERRFPAAGGGPTGSLEPSPLLGCKFHVPFTPEDLRKYEQNFPAWSASVLDGVRADRRPTPCARRPTPRITPSHE